jgi:type I restriction-modification system DNA methylase subunit
MMLPEKAQYDYLANLPESENLAEAINEAMKLIEADYEELAGILPKNYQDLTPEDDTDNNLLPNLVRIFNSDSVKKARGDVFGRIYEYFLMKFSMQAQKSIGVRPAAQREAEGEGYVRSSGETVLPYVRAGCPYGRYHG